jgi:hypothetical protein
MHKEKVGNHMEDCFCVRNFYYVNDNTEIDLENT